MYPEDCKYTEDHEWVRKEGGEYVVGITAYAAEQLGDVTYVELPDLESEFHAGDTVCAVESVKAASDVYAPVSGTVSATNSDLEERPELVNDSPYDQGWFFKLTGGKKPELDKLMDAAAYEKFVMEQAE